MDHHVLQPQKRGFTKISVSVSLHERLQSYRQHVGLSSLATAIQHLFDEVNRLDEALHNARKPVLDRITVKRRLSAYIRDTAALNTLLNAIFAEDADCPD